MVTNKISIILSILILQVMPIPIIYVDDEKKCSRDISGIFRERFCFHKNEWFFTTVFAEHKTEEKCTPIKDVEVTVKINNLFGSEEILRGITDENGRFYKKSSTFIKTSTKAYVRKDMVDFGNGIGAEHEVKKTIPVFLPPFGIVFIAEGKF